MNAQNVNPNCQSISLRRFHGLACAALAGSISLLICVQAGARPVYAIKEERTCAYCHVNPRGGGQRNPRGTYYETHKHSFVGYDEVKVMGRGGKPIFHVAWSEPFPAGVRKIGTGPTARDGQNRLVLLMAGPSANARRIEVRKWDEKTKTWVTEFTDDAPSGIDTLAVGRYSQDAFAVIVCSGTMWFWDGSAYKKAVMSKPVATLGTVILRDGSERLFARQGDSAKSYKYNVYKVNVNSSEWLTGAQDPPRSGETVFSEMKGRSEDLAALGLDVNLSNGGIVGFWDASKESPFLYAVSIEADVASTGANPSENLVLRGQRNYVTVLDPRTANTIKSLWRSDKLDGRVLDIILDDPKTGARGITVLTESADGKGTIMTFFQLD